MPPGIYERHARRTAAEAANRDRGQAPGTGWQDQAACRTENPELFYAEHPGPRQEAAAAICAACPVTSQCLQYAQATDERWGMWGGLTPAERRELARAPAPRRWADPEPCGTLAAYKRHQRHGEPVDDACRAANSAAWKPHVHYDAGDGPRCGSPATRRQPTLTTDPAAVTCQRCTAYVLRSTA